MNRLSWTEFQRAAGAEGWRVLGSGACAWFAAPSLTAGAELATRIAELAEEQSQPDVDLRTGGVRVRIGASGSAEQAEPTDAGLTGIRLTEAEVSLAGAISAAARELGLDPTPAALQSLRLVVGTTDPAALQPFWRTVLDYRPESVDCLGDPLRRDPAITFHRLDQPRPLRSRIHVDVVRTPDAVAAARAAVGQQPSGPFQVMLADPEGNEIDLVPGDRLTEGPETDDWRTVFSAMTFYPVVSPRRASELAAAVAGLADTAGIPVLVDLRPDGVMIDSGKDQWEDEPGFAALAGRIQAVARDLGHVADLTRLRFVQFGFDAVDVPAQRQFWAATLGYRPDPREFLTDLYDPRRLDPVIFFQEIDATEHARLQQRDRLQFELTVPYDQLQARLEAATAAGGRIVAETPNRCTVADPDGNELEIISHP